MPDDWKTPATPTLVGHFNDAARRNVAILTDRGDVIIRTTGRDLPLGAAERDRFIRLFMDAERQAEAWTAGHAEASDDA